MPFHQVVLWSLHFLICASMRLLGNMWVEQTQVNEDITVTSNTFHITKYSKVTGLSYMCDYLVTCKVNWHRPMKILQLHAFATGTFHNHQVVWCSLSLDYLVTYELNRHRLTKILQLHAFASNTCHFTK